MRRFKNILLVAGGKDGGVAARSRAVSLAKENEARLTAIDVVKPVPQSIRRLNTGNAPIDLQELAVEARKQQLREFLAPAQENGIETDVCVLTGSAFLEITREVLRSGHDLVLKTAQEPQGVKQRLFGSTGWHLLRKCPCPVWIVKSDEAAEYRRILAAVAPDPDDEVHSALDRKIVELASSMARREGGELHLVHAWELFGEHLLRSRARMSDAEVDRFVRETEDRHREWLDELVDHTGLTIADSGVHLVKGQPAEAVLRVTRDLQPDLLVMGTVCRTGIPGFVIGNTAEQILDQVHCSVLTVKPDGFVSPIRLQDG